jgi:putative protease
MSLAQYNYSANRGACLQTCRRAYRVIDEETGDELKVENKYIMSPKDLCTIEFLDKIIESGVSVLKIEGRGRSPEYVYTVVKAYKEGVDAVLDGSFSKKKIAKWKEELASVFNRGFWEGGYYLGKKLGEWSGTYGSKATKRKDYLGVCKNYYAKAKVGLFVLESDGVAMGDEIVIIGPTTGVVKCKVESLFANDVEVEKASKGDLVTIPIGEKIRENDKLYVLRKRS